MSGDHPKSIVRTTRPEDFDGIIEMCREVYPDAPPWRLHQLESHVRMFPEGQFVAIETDTGRVVGMASSLIIKWDHYLRTGNWRSFTNRGLFTNHDPARGRTLYGAEIMVRRATQGLGVGTKLYTARRQLVERLGLRR
ncbi:GNAT family N-acetyltransferase, partial [bacterium]|nr:GNAT family N-acetyltransferase [bacterium]